MSDSPVPHAPRSLLNTRSSSIDRRLLTAALNSVGDRLRYAQRMRGELEAIRAYQEELRHTARPLSTGSVVVSARMARRAMFGALADAASGLSIALDAVLADEGLSADQVDTGLTEAELDALAGLSEALLVLSARVGDPL